MDGLWRTRGSWAGSWPFAVSLILECLANGMSLEEIDEAFDHAFPHEAMPEVLKVASELTGSFHVAV
jgi:hypothetical protein